ncbi:hypothetical protein [Thiogranum longum]|uniref:hypothetical protein n=1 Tax=Thiogranum longum TaxID=1537524 RepID=UPI00104D6248|nr:hypothetical protein [Thiogranum longum]
MPMYFLRIIIVAATGIVACGVSAAGQVWLLGADEWARPRDGAVMVQMPPLPDVVEAWKGKPDLHLVIRYPGGEEGLLWANELRSWLVALGIPSGQQELVAGSSQPDQIELELTR